SVVRRCEILTGKGLAIDFARMVDHIQLVMKCQAQLQEDKTATLTSLYSTLDPDIARRTSLRTFLDWHSRGSKYAAVAAGGSVYALLLVAGLEMRARLGEIEGKAPWILGNSLRDPPPIHTLEGRLIRRQIVPLIAHLRKELPLHMSSFFPVTLLKARGLSEVVDFADLPASDSFFSLIQFNDFSLARREETAWASCRGDSSSSAAAITTSGLLRTFLGGGGPAINDEALDSEPNPTTTGYSVKPLQERIKTTFDLAAEGNRYNRLPDDRSANFAWTERERKWASQATEVTDLADLRLRLKNNYTSGIRSDHERYISLPPQIVEYGQALRLDCSDGSLLAFISTAMPQSLKKRLTDCLLASFGGRQSLVHTESRSSGEGFRFQALHFSWYNRHCTQGDNAPNDISPMELDNADTSRTNHSQFTPYVSKEMRDEEELYRVLKVVFSDVFQWIADVMATCLPEEFEVLKIEAEALPGNNQSAVYPFLGFVVNLNVSTKAHRDGQDKLLCLVLTLGEFEGGALGMVEPGIVLPMRSGDLVVFQSHSITHFNLHFEGLRASFVFHTDKAFRSWTNNNNRNGWRHNIALN
ncbi:hypothetical protein BV25DRAFT_1815883, partial [Artomyces pyxidatus]